MTSWLHRTILTLPGLLLSALVLAACVVAPPQSPDAGSTATPDLTTAPVATEQKAPKADVLFVRAVQAGDGTWNFAVTVQHPDTGWDNYADGWDVVVPDATVLRPNADSPFTRRLEHPHVDEQPFTRSQNGIAIPDGVTRVRVRAHSLTGGFGGREVELDLSGGTGPGYEVIPTDTTTTDTTTTVSAYFGLTNQGLDGNRLVRGRGNLSESEPLDIALAGTPEWLAAAPVSGGSVWVVALTNGQVQAFLLQGRTAAPVAIEPTQLPAGAPPLLVIENGLPRLLTAPADASPLSHPVPLAESGRIAYVAKNGDLVLWDGDELARFAVDALPDARILVDERQRLLLLTGATDRYDHGVLGDAIEAGSVTLVETSQTPRIATTIFVTAPDVIENVAPIWADLNGDGTREIIVTVSNNTQGAREIVFSETGAQIAAGSPIGRGYRWRHQLAVAPFVQDEKNELVEVLTPHIGGVVQFSRLAGNSLDTVASIPGYTSHRIGLRNLDMAVAGDFDADGNIELLLPDDAMRAIGAIRRTADGAEVAWTLPMGGSRLATNLAAVLDQNATAVGVGREDGVLRIWTQ
jgi:hypothetical protein